MIEKPLVQILAEQNQLLKKVVENNDIIIMKLATIEHQMLANKTDLELLRKIGDKEVRIWSKKN